jgi:c-di-GMP-binding flagellar brake protein YcgR
MPGKPTEERRQHSRESVRIEADLWSQYDSMRVLITDLSEAGIAIRTREPIPANTEIHIRFELPLTNATVRCDARVAWSDSIEGRAGLHFSRVGEADKRTIIHWLQNHCAKDEAAAD